MSLIRFGVKTGIVAGTVYFTIDKGVWKKSDETSELYGKIYVNVAPLITGVAKEIPVELPEIPKSEDIWYSVQNGWNKGVTNSAHFLANLPSNAVVWTKCGTAYVKKQFDQAPESTGTN